MTALLKPLLAALGRALARYLSEPSRRYMPLTTNDPEKLARALRPGDVLLVEGNTRFSTAIKYLTQSTWSHAALYVGDALGPPGDGGPLLIEADVIEGVRTVPLRSYAGMHTRICRPIGLSPADARRVIEAAASRLGNTYDLKNVIDLVRYLPPAPPVPIWWRRRMLALGSGEPTRAICSTLIAEAFQSVRYPILPGVTRERPPEYDPRTCNECEREILHVRHHSLFAPRDFDISPYFAIVKPTIEAGFDHRALAWGEGAHTELENS